MNTSSPYSYPKEKMRVLFLEGVHPSGFRCCEASGYRVEGYADALSHGELLEVIASQYLGTLADTGYLIMDVDRRLSREVKQRIDKLDSTIRTRLVF